MSQSITPGRILIYISVAAALFFAGRFSAFVASMKEIPPADKIASSPPNEHSHVRAVLVETARTNPALGQRFATELAEQNPAQAAEV